MGKSFYRVKSKYPFPYNTIPRVIKKVVPTLDYPEICLVIDLFIYFMKKKLVEEGRITIINFGSLYVHNFKRKGNIVRFKNSIMAKRIVNSAIPNKFEYHKFCDPDSMRDIFKNTGTCLGTNVRDTAYIYRVLIFAIYQELLMFGFVKLRNLGAFYLHRTNFKKTNVCGKELKIENVNQIRFWAWPRLAREVNGEEEDVETMKRANRILELHKFDRKICKKNP